jgi:hypothetical protein
MSFNSLKQKGYLFKWFFRIYFSSMGKKDRYVVEGRQYHPKSSLVDTEDDEQTIWCCFAWW